MILITLCFVLLMGIVDGVRFEGTDGFYIRQVKKGLEVYRKLCGKYPNEKIFLNEIFILDESKHECKKYLESSLNLRAEVHGLNGLTSENIKKLRYYRSDKKYKLEFYYE